MVHKERLFLLALLVAWVSARPCKRDADCWDINGVCAQSVGFPRTNIGYSRRCICPPNLFYSADTDRCESSSSTPVTEVTFTTAPLLTEQILIPSDGFVNATRVELPRVWLCKSSTAGPCRAFQQFGNEGVVIEYEGFISTVEYWFVSDDFAWSCTGQDKVAAPRQHNASTSSTIGPGYFSFPQYCRHVSQTCGAGGVLGSDGTCRCSSGLSGHFCQFNPVHSASNERIISAAAAVFTKSCTDCPIGGSCYRDMTSGELGCACDPGYTPYNSTEGFTGCEMRVSPGRPRVGLSWAGHEHDPLDLDWEPLKPGYFHLTSRSTIYAVVGTIPSESEHTVSTRVTTPRRVFARCNDQTAYFPLPARHPRFPYSPHCQGCGLECELGKSCTVNTTTERTECTCDANRKFDPVTDTCGTLCADGYRGPACMYTASSTAQCASQFCSTPDGFCMPGEQRCFCQTGFFGDDCSESQAECTARLCSPLDPGCKCVYADESKHTAAAEYPVCSWGRFGPRCQFNATECSSRFCSGKGSCQQGILGKCNCNPWEVTKPDCSVVQCLNGGEFGVNMECQCPPDTEGTFCEKKKCALGIYGSDGVCTCPLSLAWRLDPTVNNCTQSRCGAGHPKPEDPNGCDCPRMYADHPSKSPRCQAVCEDGFEYAWPEDRCKEAGSSSSDLGLILGLSLGLGIPFVLSGVGVWWKWGDIRNWWRGFRKVSQE